MKYLDEIGELLFTITVHRHGDRTPIAYFSHLSDDPERDARLSYPFGDGGLTLEGRMRGYEIGKYLRQRYDKLLSDIYFKDEIFLRSTDSERSKMTMLTSLAALYPPKRMAKWNRNIEWQPIPYTTVPSEQDFMSFFHGCKKIMKLYLFEQPNPEMLAKYENLTDVLNKHTRFNFTASPMKIIAFYDLLISQAAIGIPPPEWVLPYLDELYEASSYGMGYMFKADLIKRLAGGVIYEEFFKVSNEIIQGVNTKQRVRIYSGHDVNVASQLSAGRLPMFAPKFGAVLSIELYRVTRTGQYIVVPVYLPQAGASDPEILPIDGCEIYCDFNDYQKLLAPILINKEDQRKECQIN